MASPDASFDMRHPTTSEQELHIAKCNFMWEPLSTLWNPSSIYTWAVAIDIVVQVNKGGVIPPSIILKAAHHGLAVIYGQKNLRLFKDIAMSLESKDSGETFIQIMLAYDTHVAREALFDAYEHNSSGWRPTTYSSIAGARKHRNNLPFQDQAIKIADTTCAGSGHIDETVFVAEAVSKAFVHMEDSQVVTAAYYLRNAYYTSRQLSKGISAKLTPVTVSEATKQERECPVCCGEYTEADNLDFSTLPQTSMANKQAALLPVKRNARTHYYRCLLKQYGALELPFSNVKYDILDPVVLRLKVKDTIYLRTAAKELTDFTTAINGCYAFLSTLSTQLSIEHNVDEESYRCKGPVKLGCGHIMGASCIVEWLKIASSPTCPYCRVDISAKGRSTMYLDETREGIHYAMDISCQLLVQGGESRVSANLRTLGRCLRRNKYNLVDGQIDREGYEDEKRFMLEWYDDRW